MTDVDVATPPVVRPRRLPRRLWVVVTVAILVIAGGVVASVLVSFRYLHATPLSTDGGGWIAPDNADVRSIDAGPYTASVVSPRPGHAQAFELDLNNFSDVSQTVLGLTDAKTLANPLLTGEPETLRLSASRVFPAGDTPPIFTSKPVTIPPAGQYRLRFTQVTNGEVWSCGRSEYFTDLSLQVRVGMFTRTETLDFGGLIMEIKSSQSSC